MTDGGGSSGLCTCPGLDTAKHKWWCPFESSGSAEAGTLSPVGGRSVGTRVSDPETPEQRVAREDRDAEVRLRGPETAAPAEAQSSAAASRSATPPTPAGTTP